MCVVYHQLKKRYVVHNRFFSQLRSVLIKIKNVFKDKSSRGDWSV